MSKILKAEKVADGWYIQIIDRRHEYSESDVIKLVHENGLQINVKLYELFNKTQIIAE